MEVMLNKIKENKEKIAQLIASFSKVLLKKNCTDDVLKLLHSISFHSEQFFINSSLLLEKYDISSSHNREIEHIKFAQDLMKFQERLKIGESKLAYDLYDYVNNWFETYVKNTANKLIEHDQHI